MKRWRIFALPAAIFIAALLYALAKGGPALRHPIVALRLIRSEAPRELLVPIRGVQRSAIRDSWGVPRSGGRSHQGIDIFAPRGREIISTTPGIVVTVGDNSLGGRVVRVLGPGGFWHYYAHLERFSNVRPGDVIEKGTVLGYVGDSGNAKGTPPHLHYGIYRFRGGAINPYALLRGRSRASAATVRLVHSERLRMKGDLQCVFSPRLCSLWFS